jgi:hypothetical protein
MSGAPCTGDALSVHSPRRCRPRRPTQASRCRNRPLHWDQRHRPAPRLQPLPLQNPDTPGRAPAVPAALATALTIPDRRLRKWHHQDAIGARNHLSLASALKERSSAPSQASSGVRSCAASPAGRVYPQLTLFRTTIDVMRAPTCHGPQNRLSLWELGRLTIQITNAPLAQHDLSRV